MRYIGKDIGTTMNQLSISYTDEGSVKAPVIILIHGFPLNKSMWNNQVDLLTETCRVIAYDIRGHGSSTSGTDDFSIGLFVDDLLGLMDSLKIETAILCGLSMGGYIAINAVLNYPKRFNALILCDTNCIADTPETREKRMITIDAIQKKGTEYFANENLKNLFAPESFVTNKEKIAVVKEMIMNTPISSINKTLLALSKREETCLSLHKISIPVLILVGKEDKITPIDAARMIQINIKGSILKIIEHAGHLSNIENSYEFNIQLLKFVSSVNQQPRQQKQSGRLLSEVSLPKRISKHEKSENDMNAKILKITMNINDHYPELSKYLNEMPVTVPSEKDPEITIRLLKEYYESLHSVLNKYKTDFQKLEE
jgi:pimeloyl-ACP methyl ester carboxylesterase